MKERIYQISINGLTAIAFQRADFRPPHGIKINHEEWEEENWLKKLYVNDKGDTLVPRKMVRAGLIRACSFSELKPPGRLRSFNSLMKTCIIVENDATLEFDNKTNPKSWREYVTRGEGKVLCVRPVIDTPWSFGVKIAVFDDKIKTEVMDDLFEVFGRVCGLGEAREYMGYGRFRSTVTEV